MPPTCLGINEMDGLSNTLLKWQDGNRLVASHALSTEDCTRSAFPTQGGVIQVKRALRDPCFAFSPNCFERGAKRGIARGALFRRTAECFK